MYFVNTYRWDYPQLAALVAPRPLLISNTDKDGIFPLEGVARTHALVRKIYQLHGAEKNLGLQITEGPHLDTQELHTHAFVWFDRFLMGERRPIDSRAPKLFEPEELKVFDKLPEDQLNTTIHDTFVPTAKLEVPADAEAWKKMRDATLAALNEKVFRDLGNATVVGDTFTTMHEGVRIFAQRVTQRAKTNEGRRSALPAFPMIGLAPPENVAREKVSITVLDDKGWEELWCALAPVLDKFAPEYPRPAAKSDKLPALISEVRDRRHEMLFIVPRGRGPTALKRDDKKEIQVRRRFMLLGQTPEAIAIAEVAALIKPFPVIAEGDAAVTALYAALRAKPAVNLVLRNPPASHRDGPDLLNVMRITDLPMVAAMVAERGSVTIETTDPKPWQLTKDIAAKLGWGADKVVIRAPAAK
jgi:hypothetical protein